jgi:replicative DNA helicase
MSRLETLSASGLEPEMFPDEEEQRVFSFVREYRARYGLCPAVNLVEIEVDVRFPQYDTQNPFEFWFDQFKQYVRQLRLTELFEQAREKMSDGRVDDALADISDECLFLRDFMQIRRRVGRMSDYAQDLLTEHESLQTGRTRTGILTGFPYLDEITGGVQPGDMWVLAGESGTGKTYVLCRFMLSAITAGKTALFVSMEMPNRQLARRAFAMGAEVSATNFRLGRLSHFALSQLCDYMNREQVEYDRNLVLVEGQVNYSVEDVKAKTREFHPDIVFVDGAYMLKTRRSRYDRRWEVQVDVVEMLKQLAMEDGIAVVATFQFDQKQKIKSLSTIMGGQAVGQIASVVLGIENELSGDDYSSAASKELSLYKGREGEKGKIRLRYNMDRTIIEQESVLTGNDDMSNMRNFADYT